MDNLVLYSGTVKTIRMDNLVLYSGTVNVQAKAMTDVQFDTLKGYALSNQEPKEGYYVLFDGSNTPTWVEKGTFEAKYSAVK